jgi:predicted HTH transcriptional regulator
LRTRQSKRLRSTHRALFAWAQDLEWENKRIAEINAARVRNRGYLVFATDPSKGVDSAEYQHVYAAEARTPNQAIAKVRPLAEGRRLQAFLTTGKYRDELVDARRVG